MVSEQQQQQQQQRFLFFQVSFFESRFKNLTARCLGCKKGEMPFGKIFLFWCRFKTPQQRRNILRATAFEWMDGSRNAAKKGAIEERTTTIRRLSLVRIFFSRHRGGRSERARALLARMHALSCSREKRRGASAAGRLLVKDAKEKRERTPFEIFDGILSVVCEAEGFGGQQVTTSRG